MSSDKYEDMPNDTIDGMHRRLEYWEYHEEMRKVNFEVHLSPDQTFHNYYVKGFFYFTLSGFLEREMNIESILEKYGNMNVDENRYYANDAYYSSKTVVNLLILSEFFYCEIFPFDRFFNFMPKCGESQDSWDDE